jgi:putative membrane protein
MMGHEFFGYGGTFGITAMVFRGLFSLAVLVGLVLLVIWLVRRVSGKQGSVPANANAAVAQPSAREILQTRYANGEIDQEEYRTMLAVISE